MIHNFLQRICLFVGLKSNMNTLKIIPIKKCDKRSTKQKKNHKNVVDRTKELKKTERVYICEALKIDCSI